MILFIRHHIYLEIVTRTAKKIWDWLSSSNPRDTHPSRTFMTVTLFRRVAWNTNRRKKYLPAAVQDWRKDLLRKLRRIFDTTIEDTQFTFCWWAAIWHICILSISRISCVHLFSASCLHQTAPSAAYARSESFMTGGIFVPFSKLSGGILKYFKYKKTLHYVGSVISAFWHCNI